MALRRTSTSDATLQRVATGGVPSSGHDLPSCLRWRYDLPLMGVPPAAQKGLGGVNDRSRMHSTPGPSSPCISLVGDAMDFIAMADFLNTRR